MNNITNIENGNKNIKIEYVYHPLFDVKFYNRNNKISFSRYLEDYSVCGVLKQIINDIKIDAVIN